MVWRMRNQLLLLAWGAGDWAGGSGLKWYWLRFRIDSETSGKGYLWGFEKAPSWGKRHLMEMEAVGGWQVPGNLQSGSLGVRLIGKWPCGLGCSRDITPLPPGYIPKSLETPGSSLWETPSPKSIIQPLYITHLSRWIKRDTRESRIIQNSRLVPLSSRKELEMFI